MTIGLSAPGTPPMFQLEHLRWGLAHEGFDGVLIAQPVAAAHRVIGVGIQTVIGFDDRRRPTLGGDSVAAHRVHLGDDRDIEFGIRVRNRDSGTEARPAATDQQNVMGYGVHTILRTPPSDASGTAGLWRSVHEMFGGLWSGAATGTL